MAKVITTRLSEEEYFTDAVEMAQVNSDKKLLAKLKAGHADAKSKRGGFVG